MHMKRSFLVPVVVATLSLASGGWFLQRGASQERNVYQQPRLFEEVMQHVSDRYVDRLEASDLYRKAIDGLLIELGDPHTSLMLARDYERLEDSNIFTAPLRSAATAVSHDRYESLVNPSEREEFERLFADLLERSYHEKLDAYTAQEIRYTDEEVDGRFAVVRTEIVSKKEKSEIPVDYKLVRRNGQWKVYDLAIEDVSLVNNYRAQFNRIIQTSSYAELVRKMRAKHEDEGFSPAPGHHK